jgi:hypothetical protein
VQRTRGLEERSERTDDKAAKYVDNERTPWELRAQAATDERGQVEARGAAKTTAQGNQQISLC